MALPVLIALSSTPAPTPPPTSDTLIVGFFEDGQHHTMGNASKEANFQASVDDLQAHGLNGFMFTNDPANPATTDAEPHFYQIQAVFPTLYTLYPTPSTVVTDAQARAVIQPIAAAVIGHPSIIGLNIRDDAQPGRNQQFEQELRIFAEFLPTMPISPLIIATQATGWNVVDIIRPKAWMGYHFPMKLDVGEYDWTENGRLFKTWWNYMREQWQLNTGPLWLNLQGHNTVNPNPQPQSDLRQPTPGEVSIQAWIAFGEGANAICFYIYTSHASIGGSDLSWSGFKDLPLHYARWSAEAQKLITLENNYRIQSTKIPDRFSVPRPHYVSTLRSNTTANTYYVVVVNTTGVTTNIQVSSLWYTGTLRDLLTDQTYALNADISFTDGQGRMFRLDSYAALTPPAPAANLITNGNFETSSGGLATGWTGSLPVDNTFFHSGTQSAKPAAGSGRVFSKTLTGFLPDTDYYFSFWEYHTGLDASNNIGMRVVQTVPSINPNGLSVINWTMPASIPDWRKLIGFFRTPATGTSWRLDIVTTFTTGNVWFDDVYVQLASTYSDIDEYLIERLALPAGTVTFKPSDYGTVTGTNSTTDLGLIQQAIDAAVAYVAANDEAVRIVLDQTYAMGARGGKITIGANRNCAYGFRIPELAHDIEFDMTAAHFVYTEVPSLTTPNTATSYTMFQIGQGWDIDVDGSWGNPQDDPNWLTSRIRYAENITILAEGCTWDSSLLSDANLATLSGGVVGGCIQFAACLNCSLDGCDIDRGYGHTGTIGCNTWTRYLTVTNCAITTSHTTAFWFDGVWDSTFDNLSCHDFVATASTIGLALAPNTDNRRVSERNTVTNVAFSEVHSGISIQGSNNTIDTFTLVLLGDNVTHQGVNIEVATSTNRGTWENDGNIVRNGTVDRPSSSPTQKGFGVKLRGASTSFTGGVIRVMNTLVENCNFGSATEPEKLGQGVNLSTYAVNNTIQNNIVNGTVVIFDDSGGTATGNTVTGNTLT